MHPFAWRYRGEVPQPLTPITLTGSHVRLEPLSLDHIDELVEAANVDRSTYAFTDVPETVQAMTRYIETLLAHHQLAQVLPFAQRDLASGRLVGCTRYLDLKWWQGRVNPDEVEIGGTWLSASAQRTAINTEAKLLLLTNAFENLGVWRVAICTDARNAQSRTAILRIGAEFEGVLRSFRLRYNTPTPEARDTAIYSILPAEWPLIKAELERRIAH